MDTLAKSLQSELFYLGNKKPLAAPCSWFELDRVKNYCAVNSDRNQLPMPVTLTIAGRVSSNLNNTGIFGGWSPNGQFPPQRARRSFRLGPPLVGALRDHWEVAIGNLKKIQAQASHNSRKVRYLFSDEVAPAMETYVRMGAGVFRERAEGEIDDDELRSLIPASNKADPQWIDIADTKTLANFDVYDEDGEAVPLYKIKSVLSGAMVKVSFTLRCWRYAPMDPFSYAADVSRVDIIHRIQFPHPLQTFRTDQKIALQLPAGAEPAADEEGERGEGLRDDVAVNNVPQIAIDNQLAPSPTSADNSGRAETECAENRDQSATAAPPKPDTDFRNIGHNERNLALNVNLNLRPTVDEHVSGTEPSPGTEDEETKDKSPRNDTVAEGGGGNASSVNALTLVKGVTAKGKRKRSEGITSNGAPVLPKRVKLTLGAPAKD